MGEFFVKLLLENIYKQQNNMLNITSLHAMTAISLVQAG
jgi:hypothetical protein